MGNSVVFCRFTGYLYMGHHEYTCREYYYKDSIASGAYNFAVIELMNEISYLCIVIMYILY